MIEIIKIVAHLWDIILLFNGAGSRHEILVQESKLDLRSIRSLFTFCLDIFPPKFGVFQRICIHG